MRLAGRGYYASSGCVSDPTGGRALTDAIRAAKVSRVQLAERTGLSKSTIYDLEHGRAQGRPQTWRLLAIALGTTAERLVGNG